MADLPEIIAGFGHLLHAAGVPVTPERSARFAECVVLAQPQTLSELSWLGRITLLSSHDQVAVFEQVFAQVFGGQVDLAEFRGDSPHPPPPSGQPVGERSPGDPGRQALSDPRPGGSSGVPGGEQPQEDDEPSLLAAASTQERLSEKHFADCSPEELALIASLVEKLPVVPPRRPSRRRRRHHAGRTLDVRSTLRAAHRTSGDPVRHVRRRPTDRPRKVVLIADVSGSMEPYSRVYLHLMRGAVRALRAEAFVFATRLTRLTRPLALAHPDVAYRRAAQTAPDWSGGTRIGGALTTFLDDYGRRGVARGAVVVIVSDGWEVEDPGRVGWAMEQLSRLAYHVVWVNPRKAATDFRPLVGGMAAAMPFVTTFVSGHSVQALEDVLAAIHGAVDRGGQGPSARPAPRQHRAMMDA
jgi:uncharacterized protein with von Willebrand factor type A (vWA) domain